MKSKNYDMRRCSHLLIFWNETIISRCSRFKIDMCCYRNVMFKFEIFLKRQQIFLVKIVYVTQSSCAIFDITIKFIFSSIVIVTEITLKSCSVSNFFVFVKRSFLDHVDSLRKKTFNIFCLLFYRFVNDVDR